MMGLGLFNYWVVIFLMMVGFYTLIARGNLVKKIIGLNVFQTSVFILYALVYGLGTAQRALPPAAVYVCSALGVLIYAGVGYLTLALGGDFLAYNVLAHDPEHGQEYGILLVEFGVLVTVFGSMVAIFYAFAGRRKVQA